jgi:hypothetical protein
MTNLMNNKVAYILLVALALLVLISAFLVLMANTGGIDFVGLSTSGYCVSSGSVCTGV